MTPFDYDWDDLLTELVFMLGLTDEQSEIVDDAAILVVDFVRDHRSDFGLVDPDYDLPDTDDDPFQLRGTIVDVRSFPNSYTPGAEDVDVYGDKV